MERKGKFRVLSKSVYKRLRNETRGEDEAIYDEFDKVKFYQQLNYEYNLSIKGV